VLSSGNFIKKMIKKHKNVKQNDQKSIKGNPTLFIYVSAFGHASGDAFGRVFRLRFWR